MSTPARANALHPDRPIVLSKIRLACDKGSWGWWRRSTTHSIQIKSTLDATYKLAKFNEDVSFTDDDLVAIKNAGDAPCLVSFKSIELCDGRRVICRPSRHPIFKLCHRSVSEIQSRHTLELQPGETCVIHTNLWTPDTGPGAVFPV